MVVDVGNTRIGIGVSDDEGLHAVCRVSAADAAEWRGAILEARANTRGDAAAIVIASVNPAAARRFADLAMEITGIEPQFVRADIPLPLELELDDEAGVGVDRICSAAAAHERLGTACAVASFGTAITIDYVDAAGRFRGGTILPGLEMSCSALHAGAAQLPAVELRSPPSPFGKNTHDAIAAGVVFGAVGALREIVERFATETGNWPTLVVTGGNAELIAELAPFVDVAVPDLCLIGVALAYRRALAKKRVP
ncbi:MAG: type III pantothenate kinase [Planctomycetes bacterium]|nr:type III pantothenate kinase [Planctomycetota bacterium]